MGHKRRMAWMDLKTPEAYVFEEDSSYSVGKGKKQFENPVQRPYSVRRERLVVGLRRWHWRERVVQ